MSVRMMNRSRQLLVIPLNSGATLHLAPGEAAAGIDSIEVKNNATLQKMAQKGWVVWAETKEEGAAHTGSRRGRGR
ncbi:MAG: hypothetical protein HY282_09475 [Nitrospirae bacterium]|nr:hypothetical protein [Candidatus Manganitrophaceae bacterium]